MVGAEILHGRYRIDRRLASGGMGTVYAATDERLGRKVAVKVLKDEFVSDPRFVERFRREARAVATLSHPNVAGIFDYGQDERHFIVMEFVEGHDLARMLREEGALTPERAAYIGAQICAALAHAHAAGIVHRDIKPANVILAADDRVKVTDFGIARAAGESSLTATGSMLGTAQYLSPEQADGRGATPQSDIYSAGVVLFEMLTGTVPFTGESAIAVVMRHISDDMPNPSSIKPDVPPEFDGIVTRATAKAPEDRFSSAQTMADALGEMAKPTVPAPVGAAGTTLLEPSAPTERLSQAPPTGVRPARIGSAAIITFFALAIAALLFLLFRPTGQDPNQSEQRRQQRAGSEPQETSQETPASYTIEDLSGMHKDEAKDYLEGLGLGFEVNEERVENDDVPKDLVVGVSPEVGAVVEEGATITLIVSEGPAEEHTPPGQEKKDKKDGDGEGDD